MRIISSDEVDACLEDRAVLETLRKAFRSSLIAPAVPDCRIERLNGLSGNFSFQPAWSDFAGQRDVGRGYVGCSLVLDLPEAPGRSSSLYILFSGSGGQPIAMIDGMRLTIWRRAGLHALAAAYLSREDTSRLLVIGETPQLPRLLSAYLTVRRINSILLAGAGRDTLKKLSGLPALSGVHIGVTENIQEAQDGADMICIAGPESNPGQVHALDRLDPPAGCHIDVLDRNANLPGELLQEARLFSSDLSDPPDPDLEWAADLKDLTQGNKAGRRYYGQRTLYLPGRRSGLADHALAAHVFLRT
ncbi:ornithine cyclodeaminase [Roseibium aggregatum]|uniref:Ornithine cyclodeaminase n=1 Tax=Roseibium aggregatum TaxID=187304 RepID=A0A939EHN8_9HYPH|nr:ornithine cyclodeaminase [Roseibium aggregatum]MBN9672891.1 ornithine cyclodeaminase [Roseibium aggregatum]